MKTKQRCWLHAKIGPSVLGRYYRCTCDHCQYSWPVYGPWKSIVSLAVVSLRRHAVDYHGGVDLSD
jgi:hypothetical protein